MNIVFSADNAYTKHLVVTMVSILENNSGNDTIDFYVLTADISEDNRELLRSLIKKYADRKIEFIFVEEDLFNGFPLNIEHISKEAYFRYVIADVLPEIKKHCT